MVTKLCYWRYVTDVTILEACDFGLFLPQLKAILDVWILKESSVLKKEWIIPTGVQYMSVGSDSLSMLTLKAETEYVRNGVFFALF